VIIIETTTRERLVLVPEKQIVCTTHTRDATPEDLARGGFVLREQAAPGTLAHLRADLRDMTARAEKAEAHIKGLHLARPSEASAVAVLRELVRVGTTLAGKTPLPKEDIRVSLECFADEVRDVRTALDRARRVLAAAGPDPMPVVRAAGHLREQAFRGLDRRAAALEALLDTFDAYRKAGGTP